MPSPSEVANFQNLIATLSATSIVAVTALWNQYATAATAIRWAALQDAYPQLVDPYIVAASQLSAEWYHCLAPDSGFAVETAPPPPVTVLQTNVRWALTQADALGALSGSVERQVFTATRDTVLHNAKRENVRFARYASANACPWCRVLATRDPVYHTAESAVKGHDSCHCVAVPVRGADSYTPPDYVQQWTQDYADARDAVGGNLDDIVNHLRRTAP